MSGSLTPPIAVISGYVSSVPQMPKVISNGLRPMRSDKAPIMGENRNCISAQTVPKMPKISAARGVPAAHELHDQAGQHGHDDAHGDDVEEDRE